MALAISVLSACGGSGGSPSPGPVQTLQISPVTSSVSPGSVLHLTATLTKTDGTHADVTLQATWLGSNNAIALATSGGRVVAISPGSTTIAANFEGTVGKTSLEVSGQGGSVAPGYAYLLNGTILQYRIESNGSLAPLSVASVSAGNQPTDIVADPTGHYVYVVNSGDATISQYAVGEGGGLQALSPAVVSIPEQPRVYYHYHATIDPMGRFLYLVIVSDQINVAVAIAQYAIGSDGTLRALTPAVVDLGGYAGSYGSIAIEPGGQYAFLVADTYNSNGLAAGEWLLQFSVGNDGTLSASAPPIAAPPGATNVVIGPSGQDAYVLTGPGAPTYVLLTEFLINARGELASTGNTTVLKQDYLWPVDLVFSGIGPSAYLIADDTGLVESTGGPLYEFRNPGAGVFEPYTSVALPTSGAPAAEGTYGPNLYVLSNDCFGPLCLNSVYIDHYTIDQAGASLVSSTQIGYGSASPIVLVPAE